jgi:uncharacterized OB-fold protein
MGTDVDTVEWCDDSVEELETQAKAQPLLLGLPCAHCGAYFASQLTECPLCGCAERVKPNESISRLVLKRAA